MLSSDDLNSNPNASITIHDWECDWLCSLGEQDGIALSRSFRMTRALLRSCIYRIGQMVLSSKCFQLP